MKLFISFSFMKINIGNKEYNVELALTEDEQEKGLSNRKSINENSGMLFVFDEPQEVGIWMKDTLIPLDIVFINEELEVIRVYQGTPNSEDIMSEDNTSFVLEVNANSGIQVGDELEFSPDKKVKLHVLDENGEVQGILSGGERIFSRDNTKTLIKFAKKADSTKQDRDYITLGKRLFKFLETQDNNKPEFVKK